LQQNKSVTLKQKTGENPLEGQGSSGLPPPPRALTGMLEQTGAGLQSTDWCTHPLCGRESPRSVQAGCSPQLPAVFCSLQAAGEDGHRRQGAMGGSRLAVLGRGESRAAPSLAVTELSSSCSPVNLAVSTSQADL